MVLRGVRFGNYHTAGDWGLILNAKSIEPPTPKIVNVSIDGRDGEIDLSEALTGEIKYNNRKASFNFIITEGTYLDRESMISNIYRAVHGRKLNITLDDDYTRYLVGRCSITDVTNNNAYGTIKIEANCEPWRYLVYDTVRTIEVTNTLTDIFLSNQGVKSVIPTLTVTGTVNITFGTSKFSLSAGNYKISDLVLKSGETLIQVQGSGTLVVTYREGIL